jgi:hypothetical protein
MQIHSALILGSLLFSSADLLANDPCVNESDHDKKQICRAKQSMSASFCRTVLNSELRNHCTAQVRELQRATTWGVKPMDATNTQIRSDSNKQYIWMR